MAEILISHTYADGTQLTGSRKGDGILQIARRHGFTWRRYPGIHIRGSKDSDAQMTRINGLAEELRAADHRVRVDVDNTPRTAAEREADRADRVDARVDRLDVRAGRAAAASVAARDASRKIGDGIPFGQPKMPDHHSYARSCRDEKRMQTLDRRSWDAADKAEHLANRADGAAANEAAKHNPRAIMRRIETMSAELRGIERSLSGYRNNRGDEFTAADGDYADRLTRRAEVLREDIDHQRAKLATMESAGTFVAWAPEHFQRGDLARVLGRWYEVKRVNKKSVSVLNRWNVPYPDPETADRATPVPWDEISGRRRDGQQWDRPNSQPWPVELADKVARWADIWQTAHGQSAQTYGSDEYHIGRKARQAVRVVHGLPLDASDAETREVSSSIRGTDACRDLVAAYLAVFEQLQAGEYAHHLAAEYVDPVAGDPAWRMPLDREPVRARAARIGVLDDRHNLRFLAPGDLIAGEEGGGGLSGPRGTIVTRIVGPVAKISPVRDRRESGEWVTITMHDGTEHELKAGRWFLVHPRGTWQGTAAAALAEPVATFADPAEWAKLPKAARVECAAFDHGTFRCPHHAETYPPNPLPDDEPPVVDAVDGTRAVRRDLAALADVSTGCRLTDGTAAILRTLAADIAGEDVHADRVVRLVRGLVADTFDAALSTSDALYRLRSMRCPQVIRPRIEQAAAEIGAFLRVDGSAVAVGSVVRMRMSTGDGVATVDVVAAETTKLGCGCLRVSTHRPDGRPAEGLSGECERHTAEFDPVAAPAGVPPWSVVYRTTGGRLAHIVHDGPADGPANAQRPIVGDGGTVRVAYLNHKRHHMGEYGWEVPGDLTDADGGSGHDTTEQPAGRVDDVWAGVV